MSERLRWALHRQALRWFNLAHPSSATSNLSASELLASMREEALEAELEIHEALARTKRDKAIIAKRRQNLAGSAELSSAPKT